MSAEDYGVKSAITTYRVNNYDCHMNAVESEYEIYFIWHDIVQHLRKFSFPLLNPGEEFSSLYQSLCQPTHDPCLTPADSA